MQEAGGKTGRAGYVYVLQGDHGYYKIGRSKAVDNRICQIEPKLPFKLFPRLVVETTDAVSLERVMHKHFAARRVRGEWFSLSESDISWLTQEVFPLCQCCGKVLS